MSKRHPGLVQRGTKWCVRKRVPDIIRTIVGKREINVSLKTSDHEKAKESYWSVCAEIEYEFARAKRQLNRNKRISITTLQAEQFAKNWYEQTYGNLESNTRGLIGNANLSKILGELSEWEQTYRSNDEERAMPHLQGDADTFLIKQGFPTEIDTLGDQNELASNFDKSNAGYWKLVQLIRRGHLDAIRRTGEILNGEDAGDPLFTTHLHRPVSLAVSDQDANSISLDNLIRKYLNARNLQETDRTRKDLVAAFRVLTNIVGEHTPIDTITYDDFADVLAVLKNLPPNFSKGKHGNTSSLRGLAKNVARTGGPTLSAVSVNKYMARISSLMDWAVRTKHAKYNLAEDKLLRATKQRGENEKNARHPFSIDDLNLLFRSSTFTDPDPAQPAMYWAPLIAIFHGMRMEEILQLRADDIREENGIEFIRLHHEGDNHLKNANAKRNVPIHPKMKQLGFDNLVNRAKLQSDRRLFPDVQRSATGRFSATFTRRFSRYLQKICIKKPKVSFHSFRHNFRDAGRNCQIPDDRILQIAGWATGTGTHAIYGSGINLAELNKAIKQVAYDDLKLETVSIIDW